MKKFNVKVFNRCVNLCLCRSLFTSQSTECKADAIYAGTFKVPVNFLYLYRITDLHEKDLTGTSFGSLF